MIEFPGLHDMRVLVAQARHHDGISMVRRHAERVFGISVNDACGLAHLSAKHGLQRTVLLDLALSTYEGRLNVTGRRRRIPPGYTLQSWAAREVEQERSRVVRLLGKVNELAAADRIAFKIVQLNLTDEEDTVYRLGGMRELARFLQS